MSIKYTDPLYNTITVNDVDLHDEHPMKHRVDPKDIELSITSPDHIYGHSNFPERSAYVRTRREGENGYCYNIDPENCMVVTAVEYTSADAGFVKTSFYTDYLSKTVNVNDVRYKNKNNV